MDIKSGNEWVFPLLKKNFKKYFWNLRGFFSKSAFSFRHYLEREGKFYNTASIFFQGQHHKTEKHKLSPHEASGLIGHGPSDGTEHYFFQNTPVGNLRAGFGD